MSCSGNSPSKHGIQHFTRSIRLMHESRQGNPSMTHLEYILVVSGSQLLEIRDVVCEAANGRPAECRDLSEAVCRLVSQDNTQVRMKHMKAYLVLNVLTACVPTAYNIRMRCVSNAFQTPSSNSCMRLTTSIRNTSNLKLLSLKKAENAFYNKYNLSEGALLRCGPHVPR